MRNWICGVLLAIVTTWLPASAFATESARVASQRHIPFKTESTPVDEYGPRVGLAILALLALTGGGLYYARKHLPNLPFRGLMAITGQGKRLQVLERTRLNPRCNLYLVKLDQREFLLAQCGDNLVKVDGPLTELEVESQV